MSTFDTEIGPHRGEMNRYSQGFTLLETLLVLAILAIMISLAMPLYSDYIQETRLSAAKANAHSLRLFMEDYYLTHGTYTIGNDPSYTYQKADLATHFGWRPNGDNNAYTYTVNASANDWGITIKHLTSSQWVRCENRMADCCDVHTTAATEIACP